MRNLNQELSNLKSANVSSSIIQFENKELNKIKIAQKNAFIEVQEDKIQSFGSMKDLKLKDSQNIFDANGGSVLPSWNDSHTHLVFAKSREKEFIDKINGLS